GMALMPYSVSPFLVDHRVLPNPIMYWVTRTLKSFAGSRCPISCRAIEAAIPTTMMRMPSVAKTRVMGFLVEDDEQFDDGQQEGVDLGFVVGSAPFLGTEGHIADINQADVMFVLKVAGNFCHARVDCGCVVALDTGVCGTEFSAVGALESAHELFEGANESRIPGLLTVGCDKFVAFGSAEGIFEAF